MKFYTNGTQVGVTSNVGQIIYIPAKMSLVRIGFLNNQAIASAEIYLRPLSQPDIAAAMARSYTYPINPSCPYS
jgi:hypothetical protein